MHGSNTARSAIELNCRVEQGVSVDYMLVQQIWFKCVCVCVSARKVYTVC